MSSRNNILARLRAVTPVAREKVEQSYQQTFDAEPLVQFKTALQAVQGDVAYIRPQQLTQTLDEYCQKLQIQTYSCAQQTWLSDCLAEFRQLENYQWLAPEAVVEDRPVLFHKLDLGITSAVGWIAETGTVVLASSACEPRALSLVPPCHIAIVRESDGCMHMAEFMAEQTKPLPTNLIMVSGPSKTADIQQTLAYGAHGPARFMVIVLQE